MKKTLIPGLLMLALALPLAGSIGHMTATATPSTPWAKPRSRSCKPIT